MFAISTRWGISKYQDGAQLLEELSALGFQAVMTNSYIVLKNYGREAEKRGAAEVTPEFMSQVYDEIVPDFVKKMIKKEKEKSREG